MKRYKLNQWMLVILAVLLMAITACSDDDDETGAGQVILEAYGPSPALRGSDLTFIGKNMDKVTSVVLPDNIQITDIELLSTEKIKVTIPQNAKEGLITLVTPNGEITSKSILAYIEPISIAKISPNPVKPGETLKIEGDYLNLIQKVVFADEVTVMCDQFTTWERAAIELVVPKEAQTGKVMLADTAAVPVELESDTVLQVTLPSVVSTVELQNKKPGDNISIAGADLDLVEAVVLANSDSVNFSVTNSSLLFTLPVGTTDGEIIMLAFSGVAVPIAQLTMAIPANLLASPASDVRAGVMITISGTNMELVTTVAFPGVDEAVTPASVEADKITVEMPAAAISGNVILNTASGNTAVIAIETQKPAVTGYSSSSVSAGSDITLTGTNLDLVESVTFPGGSVVEMTPGSSENSLIVTVPVDAETGVLVLTMANGETVETSSLTVNKPEFCYIPVLPAEDVEINAGTILAVEVGNGEKLTDVQVNGISTQYIIQGTTLYALISNDASGDTELSLLSSNGSVSYTISVIGSGTVETIVMNEIRDLGSWTGEADGGAFRIYKSAFDGVNAGSTLKFYFTVTGEGQMQINDASWGQQELLEISDASQTYYEMELTQDFLNHILSTDDGWSETALVIQGQNLIISKVSVITYAATETVIMDETHDLGSWAGEADGGAFRLYKASFADVPAGSVLKFYFTVTGTEGQLQINDANWGQQGEVRKITDASQTYYEMELTQDFLSHILTTDDGWSDTALVIQGENLVISKVALVY